MQAIVSILIDALSAKSKKYITEGLFATDRATNKILAECPHLKNGKDAVIGQLTIEELQIFITLQSLSKRIAGTKRRMNEEDDEDDAELVTKVQMQTREALFYQRETRLKELVSDCLKVSEYFSHLVGERLKTNITSVLDRNPTLLKKQARPPHNSGYTFIVMNDKSISLENWQPMSGD